MIISHYNTHAQGGSAVLMKRLHQALCGMGHESRMSVSEGAEDRSEMRCLDYPAGNVLRLLTRARDAFENRLLGPDPESYYSRMRRHIRTPIPDGEQLADVIHLHWVSRWLNLESFVGSIPLHVPIVWTIHDMSPLAGGCFTDTRCEYYDGGCRKCPLLKVPFDRFLASSEVRYRTRVLSGRKVAVVANSKATRDLVDRSVIFAHSEKHTIYPGFDFSGLYPLPKHEARQRLGIEEDRIVLGFGAASLTDRNKGLDRFYEVVKRVSASIPETEVLLFGHGDPPCALPGMRIHRLGKLSSDEQLRVAMSAMDVFLMTSKMESFGQVCVEAQACGTPVWGFRVGGVSETLAKGVTGDVVEYGDVDGMAKNIVDAVRNKKLRTMGEMGAQWVRCTFPNEKAVSSYVDLYQSLIGVNETVNFIVHE